MQKKVGSKPSEVSWIASWRAACSIVFWKCFHLYLCGLRMLLGALRWYPEVFLWPHPSYRSPDRCMVMEGCSTSLVRYGNLANETMEVIRPVSDSDLGPEKSAIVHVHGGAFCFTESWHTLHALTPFVREKHVVFAVNHPYAPEDPYPVAQLSVLRAVAFIAREYGVRQVVLTGESSGATLATTAAALIENQRLHHDFCASAKGILHESLHAWAGCDDWRYPQIKQVVGICGILDRRRTWEAPPPESVPWQNWVMSHLVEVSLAAYTRRSWRPESQQFEIVFLIVVGSTSAVSGGLAKMWTNSFATGLAAATFVALTVLFLGIVCAIHSGVLKQTEANSVGPTLDDLLGSSSNGAQTHVIGKYPPLLLIGAAKDPLTMSSFHIQRRMQALGFEKVLTKVYAGQLHGFWGFPMSWTETSYFLPWFFAPSSQPHGVEEAHKDVMSFIKGSCSSSTLKKRHISGNDGAKKRARNI